MGRAVSTSVDVPADVETVWRVLTGPGWPAALAASLHDGSELLAAGPTADGGAVLTVSRRLPDGIPGYVQPFAPKDGRVTQTDTWGPAVGGGRRGTWEVSFPGSPGEVGGEMALEPAGPGSRWTVSGTVRIKVPLVGGRIEGFLAPLVEQLLDRQGEVLRAQVS